MFRGEQLELHVCPLDDALVHRCVCMRGLGITQAFLYMLGQSGHLTTDEINNNAGSSFMPGPTYKRSFNKINTH